MNNNSVMHRLSIDELKKKQLEIMDYVASFCDNHNIRYWIDCGTLLGAVRHKGYIPWDDDIDVGMLREDYDKFMMEFPSQSAQYIFKCIENDQSFPFPFGKVLDTDTVLYEPDKNGIRYCINIDIFPYDNAPILKNELANMYRIRDVYKTLRLARLGLLKANGNIFKQIAICFTNMIVKLFPKNYFTKKIIENSKKYINSDSNFIGDFTSTSKIYCSKDIVSEFIEIMFEGRMYKAPKKYDVWLTDIYGDYLTPPPIDKRDSGHVFEAYSKGESVL